MVPTKERPGSKAISMRKDHKTLLIFMFLPLSSVIA